MRVRVMQGSSAHYAHKGKRSGRASGLGGPARARAPGPPKERRLFARETVLYRIVT